jgi:hypothetical protein
MRSQRVGPPNARPSWLTVPYPLTRSQIPHEQGRVGDDRSDDGDAQGRRGPRTDAT